jgi:hypothetical protein
MIDHQINAEAYDQDSQATLPPPRFDASASANARPVEPIATGRNKWHHTVASLRRMITNRTKTLILIAVTAITILVVGGTMLVKDRQLSRELATATGSVSALDGTGVQKEEPLALGAAVGDFSGIDSSRRRVRTSRQPVRKGRAPRAYRAGVIR